MDSFHCLTTLRFFLSRNTHTTLPISLSFSLSFFYLFIFFTISISLVQRSFTTFLYIFVCVCVRLHSFLFLFFQLDPIATWLHNRRRWLCFVHKRKFRRIRKSEKEKENCTSDDSNVYMQFRITSNCEYANWLTIIMIYLHFSQPSPPLLPPLPPVISIHRYRPYVFVLFMTSTSRKKEITNKRKQQHFQCIVTFFTVV